MVFFNGCGCCHTKLHKQKFTIFVISFNGSKPVSAPMTGLRLLFVDASTAVAVQFPGRSDAGKP